VDVYQAGRYIPAFHVDYALDPFMGGYIRADSRDNPVPDSHASFHVDIIRRVYHMAVN
jgi:hypothetical protein